MVLVIAAGIHFIAPERPTGTTVEPPSSTAAPAESAPAQSPPSAVLARSGAEQPSPAAPRRLRPPSSRASRPSADAVGPTAPPTLAVDTPQFDAPLVASLEIPENGLPLESIGMPVSAEFVEPLVMSDREGDGDRDDASRAGRPRDPVTAAFVTAGSAVAGGFRSAGRALKRAF